MPLNSANSTPAPNFVHLFTDYQACLLLVPLLLLGLIVYVGISNVIPS